MTARLRLATAFAVAFVSSTALAQQLQYPATKKGDQVDVYHGTKVADPYRWLEDDMSPQTAAWVEAQNKVTFPYLEAIPYRAQLQARVEAAERLREILVAVAQGSVLLLQQERRACRTRASSTSRRASRARRKS